LATDRDDDIESGDGILATRATVGWGGSVGNIRQVALDLLTGEQVEKAVCLPKEEGSGQTENRHRRGWNNSDRTGKTVKQGGLKQTGSRRKWRRKSENRHSTYGSKVDLNQGTFLTLVFFEDGGVRVFGTAHFEHDIPSVVVREDRRTHLLLDRLAQELQK
jgi:hypothetical protein